MMMESGYDSGTAREGADRMMTAFIVGSGIVAIIGIMIAAFILLAADTKDWPPENIEEDE